MGDVINLEDAKASRAGLSVHAIGDLAPGLEQSLPDLLETFLWNGEWFEPPVSFDALTKLLRVNAHHESALFCKKTTVVKGYKPGAVQVLSRRGISATAFDYIYLGNAFLQQILTRGGNVVALRHLPARSMRRGKNQDEYYQVNGMEKVKFKPGEIIHLTQYGPETTIYGMPEYLGAINALLLNEAATLFRRMYYANGAHAGFILVSNGEGVDEKDVEGVTKIFKETKGTGNFKPVYIHLPVKDGKMELIRVGDFAKDEFSQIKTISRDDIISAHRVPPQILAVLTDNKLPITGDLDKIIRLYNGNVVEPIQLDLKDGINENLDRNQWIDFDPYQIDLGEADSPASNTPP